MARTIVEAARGGSVPEELAELARREGVAAEKLRDRVASGRVVVMRGVGGGVLGVGEGLRTKVNANVGTSGVHIDVGLEREKLRVARRYGADAVMDLSVGGDLDSIRRALLEEAGPLPLGTVPVYQAWVEGVKRYGPSIPPDYFLKVLERHLRDGVAFATIHAALTRELAERAVRSRRVMPIVSRGGAMLAAWMLENGEENPYRANWGYVLELFAEHDAVISIGDALRPGALADQHDGLQVAELVEAAKLVEEARRAGVQVMVEGPGHMTLDEIPANVRLEKRLTRGAPYYVLGPLVTDTAIGYDHVAAAIGGAVAAAAGADMLCYVTPSEHLGLPGPEEVREGVIAARIAAHAGDLVKLGPRAAKLDAEVSLLRARLRWGEMLRLAPDPERAKRLHEMFGEAGSACSMCGQYCALLLVSRRVEERRPSLGEAAERSAGLRAANCLP